MNKINPICVTVTKITILQFEKYMSLNIPTKWVTGLIEFFISKIKDLTKNTSPIWRSLKKLQPLTLY